jgi:hypothetical protein
MSGWRLPRGRQLRQINQRIAPVSLISRRSLEQGLPSRRISPNGPTPLRHNRAIVLRLNPLRQHNQITALANLRPNGPTQPNPYNPTIDLRRNPTLRLIRLRTRDVRIARPQRDQPIRLQ